LASSLGDLAVRLERRPADSIKRLRNRGG